MVEKERERSTPCRCPYCDADLDEAAVFCVACQTVFLECPHCGGPVREGVETCPTCERAQ